MTIGSEPQMKMTNNEDLIVIVGAARTPIGGLLGIFSSLTATALGTLAIKAALERAEIDPTSVDEVIMGCVLPAGLGQAPARQAAIHAGIPTSTPCSTINKVCGSSMKAIMLAYDILQAHHEIKIIVAGGMESMSNAPYLLDKARQGYRLGHAQIKDHMYLDGLEDAYDKGKLMGEFAEETAEKYGFSRAEQDAFALLSLTRAQKAQELGWFLSDVEIVPVEVKTAKGTQSEKQLVKHDELPTRAKPERIQTLKPVFKENGTITAANSSSISDGASAVVLMRLSEATKRVIKPIAKIVGHSSFSQEPKWFTTAPIGAIKQLLNRVGWDASEVDLYEINEAFAVVNLVTMKELGISADIMDVHGGAMALGHPIGATGARIVCTLLGALKRLGKKRGVAAVCIGGGEATAIAVEIFS
jgi:acetyl-CoA C-acetyltransferase